jgi:hypothetical protein
MVQVDVGPVCLVQQSTAFSSSTSRKRVSVVLVMVPVTG